MLLLLLLVPIYLVIAVLLKHVILVSSFVLLRRAVRRLACHIPILELSYMEIIAQPEWEYVAVAAELLLSRAEPEQPGTHHRVACPASLTSAAWSTEA